MGTIIALNANPERPTRPASEPASCEAEIVIFPGVRYERAPAAETGKQASKGRRRRDVLQIPE